MTGTQPGITLRRIAFTGPGQTSAALDFSPHLNVVYGASNTGKSFAVKAIDCALGSNRQLPDIDERRPYDRAWLAFMASGSVWTSSRALAGGNIELWPTALSGPDQNSTPRIMGRRNDAAQSGTISQFLLDQIGLGGKIIATKASGAKRRLSFRDLARFCLVDESSILSENSPALSGQHSLEPAERNIFKLLLTGSDDSGLVETLDRKTFRASKTAKIELIDELLADVQGELDSDFPDALELPRQESALDDSFAAAQAQADAVQESVKAVLDNRRQLSLKVRRAESRMSDIELNLRRFEQLQAVYQSDIDRLEALEEAGFVVSLGGGRDCPLCGAPASAQQHSHAIDDVKKIRASALAEIRKIRQQQGELAKTVERLIVELASLRNILPRQQEELRQLDAQVSEQSPIAAAARRRVADIMATRDWVKRGLSLLDQKSDFTKRKAELEGLRLRRSDERSRQEVSSGVTHEFAQVVSRVLTAWRFPGKGHVAFDEGTFDLKIDGKLRRDNGKGVRAITHAAFKVALLMYCRERGLPHPGFLVLDTPLLTYRDPMKSRYGELAADEREIANMSLKDYFFEHLLEQAAFNQFIVFENVDPPADIWKASKVEIFSGEQAVGRFGLFPAISQSV